MGSWSEVWRVGGRCFSFLFGSQAFTSNRTISQIKGINFAYMVDHFFFDNHFSASIFHIIHIIRIEANSIRWVCFSFQNGVFLTERLLSWLDRFVDHQLYDCQECFWKPGVFGENYAIIFMLLVKISCEQSSSCIKLSLKK